MKTRDFTYLVFIQRPKKGLVFLEEQRDGGENLNNFPTSLATKGLVGLGVFLFDPTYEGNNPRVMKHYFEPGVGITASGLVLRHVLEHIQDPFSFLLQLKEANGGKPVDNKVTEK